MPLRRTPPKTPTCNETDAQSAACKVIAPTTVSTPNMPASEPDYVNSRRRKRDSDCSDFMEEIRELLNSHTIQTDGKLRAIQTAMTEIKVQNAGIKDSIDHISKQYDDMVIQLQNLEAERKVDRSYINQLEERVENLERMTNSSKIELKNIPKKQGETKEDLRNIITETASVLETHLQRHDIKDVYRLNKKDGVSTIMVDFTTTTPKDSILRNLRQFNKKNSQNKLNTNHINKEGPSKPIYITEVLTLKAQRLYYLARNYAKDNGYKFCWTSFGRVFLRKVEGGTQILIKSESDITNLRLEK